MNAFEPSSEDVKRWMEWVAERPSKVKDVAEKVFPWKLYKLKTSGHFVTLYSIDEPKDGSEPTLKVDVSREFNQNLEFERRVFGIRLEDLEEVGNDGVSS